jgi:hypothetical protein
MSNITKLPKNKSLDVTDERLETIAKDIETTGANATFHIAAQLAEARDIFRFRRDEGGFGGWVRTRLGYSRSKAYNLVNIHEQFGGEKKVSKRLDTFPDTILFLLAASPIKVRDEIIERAQAGEMFSVAEIKRIIKAAKGGSGKPPRSAKPDPDNFNPTAIAGTLSRLSAPALMQVFELLPREKVQRAIPQLWVQGLANYLNAVLATKRRHQHEQYLSVVGEAPPTTN